VYSLLDAAEYSKRCLGSRTFTRDQSEPEGFMSRKVCFREGTSKRSFSNANPPLSKGFGFTLILREGTPAETSVSALGSTERRLGC
jgi:hypothetical protein